MSAQEGHGCTVGPSLRVQHLRHPGHKGGVARALQTQGLAPEKEAGEVGLLWRERQGPRRERQVDQGECSQSHQRWLCGSAQSPCTSGPSLPLFPLLCPSFHRLSVLSSLLSFFLSFLLQNTALASLPAYLPFTGLASFSFPPVRTHSGSHEGVDSPSGDTSLGFRLVLLIQQACICTCQGPGINGISCGPQGSRSPVM